MVRDQQRQPSDGPARTVAERFESPTLLTLVGATAFLALTGCSLDVDPPEQTLWEGDLAPTGAELVLAGSIAAVSGEFDTQASIQVTGGEAGDRWIWRFREGTCDEPGPIVGSEILYPVLEATEETVPDAPGTVIRAAASVLLDATLDETGDYHGTVAAEAEPDESLACGSLELT